MIRVCLQGFAALLLIMPSPIVAEVSETQPLSNLQKAQALQREGKPQEALALLDPIVAEAEAGDAKDPKAMCPGVAAAFLMAALQKQDPRIVVSVTNDWCKAMLARGFALTELKRFKEAAAMLGKLVRHDPDNAQYLAEYAFALRSDGELEKALETYKRVDSAASRYSDKAVKSRWRALAKRGIGYIYFDMKRWDEAAAAYRESLKFEPDSKAAKSELELIEKQRIQ